MRLLLVITLIAAAAPARADDLADQLPRIPPRTPQESAAMIKMIPGFKAELVAAEPLVFSPVAIDFDENGRAFVCEMIDYPFPSPEPLGKLAVLQDSDGDGVFDKRAVLAEKLHWPTAVVCYDGGCFVGSAPDILYLKDTTGDGVADVRKTVFTGFGTQNVQGLLNSFRWGIDNRIHGATGTNGAKVRRADLKPPDSKPDEPSDPIDLRGRDFSFDPRLLDLRAESGGGQHGMSFDDFGRKFVSSNSDHIQQVVYDDRYASASSGVTLPPARVSIAADGPQAPVFRISPVEPWRIVRTRMRVTGEVKGAIEGGGTPAGYFTGATGVTLYRGDAFPPEYRGQAFVGDVGSNLVHRKVLKPTDSVLFRAERADEGCEFLASEDIWFRPAQFANAPDGTLYVLDVCREVIEHPNSLPDQIKQHLDLTSGRDRGRIYRVVPDGYRHRPPPKLSEASPANLVKLLSHPNGWHRDTASRLLYERQDKTVLKALNDLATLPQALPAGRIHALYALDALGGRDPLYVPLADLLLHPDDEQADVLRHAIRLAEKDPRLVQYIAWIPRDEPELALQQLLSISALKSSGLKADEDTARAIADLLRSGSDDPYQRAAALAAVGQNVGDVFWQAIRDHGKLSDPETLRGVRALARLAAAAGQNAEIERVVKAINTILIDNAPDAARQAVAGILEGARQRRGQDAEAMLTGRSAGVLKGLVAASAKAAADAARPVETRIADVQIVRLGTFEQARTSLSGLIGGQEPPELQVAAVTALAGFTEPEVGDVLTAAWPRMTPAVRAAAVDVLLARPNRAMAFLTAIQKGTIPATDLDAGRLARLGKSSDAAVRKLAEAIGGKMKLSPRADVVEAYRKALDLKGDADRGKLLFTQNCATCHRVADVGTEIGPNLAAMKSRGAEAVLVNVLDPNREVNGQFVEYIVDTKDGQTLTGLLSAESSAAITLLKPGGQTETISRTDIEKLRGTGLSLMPEGLERQLDAQAVADLIAFVMK